MGTQDPTAIGAETALGDLPPLPREVPPFYAGVVLWGRSGDILLQKRDDLPDISSPGWIGTFGGGGDHGETAIQCAIREIKEETNIDLDPDHLIPLLKREKRFQGPTVIPIFTFCAIDVPEDSIVITEGTLLRVKPDEVPHLEKITASALESVELMLERFNH